MDDQAAMAQLLTMYGGSGAKAGMTANDLFSNSGDLSADENAMAVMRAAQKVDPNARLSDTGGIQFDRSLLPKSVLGDMARFDRGGGKGGNFWNSYALVDPSGKANGGAEIKDPSKIIHDPNYGDFVAKNNLGVAPGDSTSGFMGQLGKYMPSAISAVMSMASGIPVASLVQGVAAADSGDWKGVSMDNLLASIAGMIANQYLPGASTAINLANNSLNRKP